MPDELTVDFSATVRRYGAGVLRYCLLRGGDRQLAEDAAQEAMLRLYSQLREGKAIEDQGTWLFSIARNCCREMNRNRKVAEPTDREEAPRHGPSRFAEMIEGLAARDRMLLIMKHVEGMKCREMAERLGEPLGTVTSALARIYSRLRREYGEGARS